MKLVHKRLIIGLAAVLSTSVVVSSSALAAKKKIRWWVINETQWRVLAEKYEKQNRNVDIELVSGAMDKFYTMISAGMMPDVWGPWETPGITADVIRGWVTDLGPYIKRDGKAMKIDDFFPGLMRQFKVKGKQYSLPIFSYTDWFFYNTTMYAQAGLQPPPLNAKDKSWNWDKMLLNAQKTTKRSADGNRILQAGMEFSRDFWCTPNWVRLWNVDLYSDAAAKSAIPQEINLDSPQMKNAITKMWELIYRYKVTAPAFQSLAGLKTAGSIEHGWNVFNMMTVKKLTFAIAPLPWAVTNKGTLWPDGWRISSQCKNKEEAWKFVKFLCEPENMKYIVTDAKSGRQGSPVARKSVFRETLGKEIAAKTGMSVDDVFRVHEQADDVGIVKESETISLHTDISKTYVEPVLNDIWANKIDPNQATAKLQQTANKGMPILFKRWMRNIRYTGKEKW